MVYYWSVFYDILQGCGNHWFMLVYRPGVVTSIYLVSSHGGDTLRLRDSWSEGPGFESCAGCFVVDIYQRCLTGLSRVIEGMVVCKTAYGCVHIKDPLESVEISMGLSPGSRFLSVTDRSITVMKGDSGSLALNLKTDQLISIVPVKIITNS